MTKKNIIIVSVVAILIIIIGAFQIFGKSGSPQYEIAKVERGDLTQTVEVTGRIDSAQNLSLHFETIGRVAKVYVKEGEEVKKGRLFS